MQAHLRRLSPYPFGSAGKGLERETLCPFPRVRRFGTHSETGSKFLLLFSIKSKEEILCFAAKVPNGRTPHVCQAIFLCFCALFSGAPAPFLSSKNRRTFRCGGSFSRKSRFLIYLSAVRPAHLPSPSKSYPLHLQYRHLPMSFPHCGR